MSDQERSSIPCPFCGCDRAYPDSSNELEEGTIYFYACPQCGVEGPFAYQEADAAAKWEQRTGSGVVARQPYIDTAQQIGELVTERLRLCCKRSADSTNKLVIFCKED